MKNLFVFLLLISSTAVAQKKSAETIAPKKTLSHDVYDSWKDISTKAITTNGMFAAFIINPQDGDGKVVFYNVANKQEDSVKRGAELTLAQDSKFAIFRIKPEKEKVKELRRQKKKKEDLPKDSLGIYALADRSLTKIPFVKSYKTPEKSGGWLAYQLEAKKDDSNVSKPKSDSTKKSSSIVKPKKVKKNNDENGYTLVLRQLEAKKETHFGFVNEYIFSKFGQGLLFSTTGNDSTLKPGVYWYDLQKETLQNIYEGKARYKYKGLACSEDGTQSSFLLDSDTTKALIHYPTLFHWRSGDARAQMIADEKTTGIPSGWLLSEHFTPKFSKNGSMLFLGIAPRPIVQDTSRLDEEIIKVEVWNWKDSVIYPQQNKQLERQRKLDYRAVIHLNEGNRLVPLANETIPSLTLADEGNAPVALAVTDKPYRWNDFHDISGFSDGYIVNVKTGVKTLAAQKIKGYISISPKSNYLYWFSLPDTSWFAYSVLDNKTYNISSTANVLFADEEDDHPDYPYSYGIAGWIENDQRILVYDRYDIWSLDPQNKTAPVNLTKTGRSQKIVFRYLHLVPDEHYIKSDSDLLLSAFDESTKAAGYYLLSLKTGQLKKLLMSNHRYAGTIKAREGDQLLFTREDVGEFPDVWISNIGFTSTRKITDANPQIKKYNWARVEMVAWHSLDNVPLKGLLYKPENFNPTKKYPMIVHFYEKGSDGLHSHFRPQPSASTINRIMFASNEYLVFVPDIVYKIGYPGESAFNCIMSGVNHLISKGFVDEKNIGVQGQSWGGYQTAYLITRTNLFKAAGAGAAVVNMTSAYGGIRWGSGISRMFQYEHSQSRIGGTLWEKPMNYIENSPLFFAPKIQTPVLIMQNDKDDAVPWYQGIEFYMALRRLQKPVWMLVYNEELHNLQQRQNRKDYSVRLMQFFDHFLKGAPEPPWMKTGVPAIEKGIRSGY